MDNVWRVGDKVLCVRTHSEGAYFAGREYVIDGFSCCAGCGEPTIMLLGYNEILTSVCVKPDCLHEEPNVRQNYWRSSFIRPDLASLTTYHKEVTVREISVPQELKKLENLKN